MQVTQLKEAYMTSFLILCEGLYSSLAIYVALCDGTCGLCLRVGRMERCGARATVFHRIWLSLTVVANQNRPFGCPAFTQWDIQEEGSVCMCMCLYVHVCVCTWASCFCRKVFALAWLLLFSIRLLVHICSSIFFPPLSTSYIHQTRHIYRHIFICRAIHTHVPFNVTDWIRPLHPLLVLLFGACNKTKNRTHSAPVLCHTLCVTQQQLQVLYIQRIGKKRSSHIETWSWRASYSRSATHFFKTWSRSLKRWGMIGFVVPPLRSRIAAR